MERAAQPRAKNIVVYVFFSLILVIAGSALIREKSFQDEYRHLRIGGDAASYIAMAEGTGEEISAPFRYRLLFPFVASLSDLPAITAFRWITFVSLFLFYFFGFLLCELRRCGLTATMMSMAFVFLSPWHLYIYQNPFITDGMVQLAVMVLLYSIVRKNIWLFGIAALAGIFLHERIIFFLPLWMAVHDGRRGGIIAASIGLAYIGLRLAVGGGDGFSHEYPIGTLSIFTHPLETIKDAIVGSLPLYMVAFSGYLFQNAEEKMLTRPALVIFLAASVIPAVAATDTGRMLLGMAPLTVLIGVSFFEKVHSVWKGCAVLGTALIVSLAYLPVTFIPIPEWLFYRKYFIAIFFLCFLLVYGMILAGNINRFRSNPTAS